MKTINWTYNAPDDTGWKKRHLDALEWPQGLEVPISGMLSFWLDYAERHQAQYESTIGEDGALGVEWAQIGRGILGLLNGETGRLDCGTLDTIIRDNLAEMGFSDDT